VNGTRSYILIWAAALILLCGCEAKTRYQVLSFFFEDVPQPGSQQSEKSDKGPSNGSGGVNTHASTHGPYGAKMCMACHDSNTNALLLPKVKLCLMCHELQTGRRQHGPVASGGCLVCHDPHRSSNEYLLISAAGEFCMYCHDAKEIFSHEVHRGNTVSCTTCHSPHGSDKDFFLR
jgi:predicted CXXCH cytochrome family protein